MIISMNNLEDQSGGLKSPGSTSSIQTNTLNGGNNTTDHALLYNEDEEGAVHFLPNYLLNKTWMINQQAQQTTDGTSNSLYKRLSMPARSKSDGGVSYLSYRSSLNGLAWIRGRFRSLVRKLRKSSNSPWGTFRGVFVPAFQTIMNALFFVRCTFMVGSIGVTMSLLILLISGAIVRGKLNHNILNNILL